MNELKSNSILAVLTDKQKQSTHQGRQEMIFDMAPGTSDI